MVRGCGNGDADGLNLVIKVRVVEERLGVVPFRNFSGTGQINIDHPDQFHPFHLGIFFSMELAQVTDTDHAHLDLIHLSADPPLRVLDEIEVRCWTSGIRKMSSSSTVFIAFSKVRPERKMMR